MTTPMQEVKKEFEAFLDDVNPEAAREMGRVDIKKDILLSFLESSIKQAVEAERKEIAVFVENLFKAGAINRGQLLGSSIVEAIRNFPPKGITKKEEKELLKHMGHLAYTGKGKKKE